MNITLRELSPDDGMEIYELLQAIPADENGFMNGCHGKSVDEFRAWLRKSDDASRGVGLEDWMVPQTVYWLIIDGVPAGMGKLRHRLTERLLAEGGNCGYAIRPGYRGRGLGRLLLRLLMEEARSLGIPRLLLTVRSANTASIKTGLGNGGVIDRADDARHFIWVDC